MDAGCCEKAAGDAERCVCRKVGVESFPAKWDGRRSVFAGWSREQRYGHPIDKDCFLVLKGSRIAPDVTSGLPQNYVEQRKTLLGIGIIQNNVFAEDNVFTSASAAASIILGRSSNGRREWAKLDGRTLAQSGH